MPKVGSSFLALFKKIALVAPLLFALAFPIPAQAQTDEIQVYDAGINDPGEFNFVWHNNYTPIGRKEPDFPGGVVPNHSLIGVATSDN